MHNLQSHLVEEEEDYALYSLNGQVGPLMIGITAVTAHYVVETGKEEACFLGLRNVQWGRPKTLKEVAVQPRKKTSSKSGAKEKNEYILAFE